MQVACENTTDPSGRDGPESDGLVRAAAILLLAALAIAGLAVGARFLVPLAEALLVWFVVNALADALRRLPLIGDHLSPVASRWIAAGIVALAGVAIVYSGVRSLAHVGPQAVLLQTSLGPLMQGIATLIGVEIGAIVDRAFDSIGLETLIRQVVVGLISLINQSGLVAIYVAFLLVDQTFFPAKLQILFPDPDRRTAAAALFADLGSQIGAYLWLMTKVSAATAALSFVPMATLGLESPIFWASLVFVLNFIPTIGSILGTLLPAAFALVQFEDVGSAALLMFVLGAIQFSIGSVVLPRLAGDRLNLSLTVTVLCLFVWGGLWGVTGMFLAVPLTAVLLLIAARFDRLRPLAVLLSKTGVLVAANGQATSPPTAAEGGAGGHHGKKHSP